MLQLHGWRLLAALVVALTFAAGIPFAGDGVANNAFATGKSRWCPELTYYYIQEDYKASQPLTIGDGTAKIDLYACIYEGSGERWVLYYATIFGKMLQDHQVLIRVWINGDRQRVKMQTVAPGVARAVPDNAESVANSVGFKYNSNWRIQADTAGSTVLAGGTPVLSQPNSGKKFYTNFNDIV